jgi:seryl-tRNA synthetase
MHDIKFIRNKPNEFQLLMEKRGLKIDLPEILELDSQIRNYQTSIQEIQEKRNNTSKDIGKLISQGKDVAELQSQVSVYKSDLTKLDEKIKTLSNKLHSLLITFPNYL